MAKRGRHAKKNKKKRVFFILLFLVILGISGYYICTNKDAREALNKIVPIKPTLKIVDVNSDTRPIAVMIDNSDAGRPNHAGLQDAFLTYEAITEGGITRMMLLFKDQSTDLIGPVRSSRHYFLDYAMENDAIYAHFGWSDRARDDIYSLDIDNLNGITNASSAYWRDENLYAPHNVYTTIKNLKDSALEKKYEMNTNKGLVLNYSISKIDLAKEENKIVANNISLPYSYYHTTSYTYNSNEAVYYRSINDSPHTDYSTKKQYHVKNIIVAKIANNSFDDYGRQELDNIGTGDGYFITNGYAIPITWSKDSRASKTIYKKINGEVIKVNDGNTAIQLQPINEDTIIN